MIMHGQRDVAAQQFHGVEFAVLIQRVAGTAAERYNACQPASGPQRRQALEQFRRDIAVGTQKNRIRGRVKNDWAARRSQRVHMFGEERNEGRVRHQGKPLSGCGREHGRLVVEQEERAFARARRFHDRRQHQARCLSELALRR